MPRIKRSSTPVDQFDEDFDDDSCSSKNGNPPIQRNAANARERARMRVLSSAFGRLKTKLPNIPPDTKLSKLDTLRLATIYIKQLKTLVEGSTINSENAEAKIHITDIKTLNFQQCSQSMTWPFAFQHIHTAGRQLALQFPNATWESTGGDLERKNPKNDTSNLSIDQINESAANLFQNKCNINADASNVNNCLFDCLHQQQQQQQLSYYIHRNHYDYNEPDYANHQHQDMQIH